MHHYPQPRAEKPILASASSITVATNWPPVLTATVLAELIGMSVRTVLANKSRAPHKLPPACSPPGTKQPLWLLTDVLAWVEAAKLDARRKPEALNRDPAKTGRPTIVEQEAAKAAGMTIAQYRAALAGQERGVI